MIRNEIRDGKGRFKKSENVAHRGRGYVPIVAGIYKITNPLGEVYIGGSRTIYRRWLRHREARKNIGVHRSIKKHGWRSHVFEIVHELPQDISGETLLTYEQMYIDAYLKCGVKMLNAKEAGSDGKLFKKRVS